MKYRLLIIILAVCVGSGIVSSGDENAPVGSKQNPIKVSGVEMERFYCKFLRTPEGETLDYERVGSVGKGPYGNILDLYRVTTKDGEKQWDVYIDMYHEDVKTLPQIAPPGLLTLEQFSASKMKGRRKSYINIWQPSGSSFDPVVAADRRGLTYVSRVVPTDKGRDIEVLVQDAAGWSAVGKEGKALTSNLPQTHPFLGDMIIGPDGVLWVLVHFTFPERSFLYSFEGQAWRLRGPADGNTLHNGVYWDSGLHFLGDQQTPCHIFTTMNGAYHILSLKGKEWERTAVGDVVASHVGVPEVRRKNISKLAGESWIAWETSRGKPGNTLKVLGVTGTQRGDVIGPITIEQIPVKDGYFYAAVSGKRVLAVGLQTPEGITIHRCTLGATAASEVKVGPTIPEKTALTELKWSPDGELYALFAATENSVELARVDGDKFTVVATHTQPKDEGEIFDPRIYFDGEGKPVVVWGDWFP
jgi:hypothetical protein